MKYIFSIILYLVYSLPMLAQSFAPPMYLPEMKIGHLRSEQALETALKKSYSTSLILMDERKMG
ncbi:MAG: hypothetical protein VX642_09585, partial [Bdellovibrionota bacterium]|nr:hypothetical protein [Bdellovibrionota bacterium]